ncbi:hypothetical protein ABIB25_003351 [Nakamurella sp. UYEF19]|uniref:hypothetical protein n=1 Tax=Nakamurella sp. UYEF19 TaxID=1756392 RepID=UPI0033996E06
MTTMKRYASGVLLAALLAGCTSATTGSPTPATAAPALSGALAGVAPAALGDNGDFEFGDTVRLEALAAADKKVWGYEIGAGSGSLSTYRVLMTDALGIDLGKSTSILNVGAPPATLVVVSGGQDAAAVTAAATKSGWKGSGTLIRAIDLTNAADETAVLTISVPQIRPAGADVVLGGARADLSLAGSGKGAGSGAVLAAGTNCLGDVVMAQGTGFAEKAKQSPTAVGVRATADKITSVICRGAGSADEAAALADRVRTDLASGSSKASRRPYKQLLPGAVVEILSGTPSMVRITVDTTGQTPDLVRRMLFQDDLPGGN